MVIVILPNASMSFVVEEAARLIGKYCLTKVLSAKVGLFEYERLKLYLFVMLFPLFTISTSHAMPILAFTNQHNISTSPVNYLQYSDLRVPRQCLGSTSFFKTVNSETTKKGVIINYYIQTAFRQP